jgi:hypothetical protein
VFEDGLDYLFTMSMIGLNDGVYITTEVSGEPCNPISNLSVTVPANTTNVALTWTAAAGGPTGYQILRDNAVIATVMSSSYTDLNVTPGNHNYCVKALFSGDCIPQTVCGSVVVPEILGGGCEAIIVGEGTAAVYTIPVNTYWGHSYSQQIFDAADLGDPGTMSSISFEYVHSTQYPTTNPLTVYIGHTTKNTFTNTSDYIPLTELEMVFSGVLTFNNSQKWFTITFDNEFEYQGGNIVVAVHGQKGSDIGSTGTFRYHVVTGNKTIYYYHDSGGVINPANPTTALFSSASTNRNNVRFVKCLSLSVSKEICIMILVSILPYHTHGRLRYLANRAKNHRLQR